MHDCRQNIIRDFGAKSDATREGVCALAEFAGRRGSAAEASLAHWTALFRKTCGRDWPKPKARLDRLARHYGMECDPSRPEVALFALQSWYVFLVRLFVGQVVAATRGRPSPLSGCERGEAKAAVESLESGRVFSALGVTDPWRGDPFNWIAPAWSAALERAVVKTADRIVAFNPAALIAAAAAGVDLLKPLYESLFPRTVRHALGEYYTPDWLAEHVLDQVGYTGRGEVRLLDPTCGSGTFLLAAIRRWRRREGVHATTSAPPDSPPAFPAIAGFDLHPLAVASARANYLLAMADFIVPGAAFEVPVFARDAILDPVQERPFDVVVGNPPWIAWDNLPGEYREATKPLWQRYGLFSLSGSEARHGGGKKDLSMLVLYATADRYLQDGGRLGMVVTQTAFQSKGAGDGFRRFRIGTPDRPAADEPSRALRVLRVDDLVELRPFGDAANWTSVVCIEKGRPTQYPVRYVKWTKRKAGGQPPDGATIEMLAEPIDASRPTAPWIVRPRNSEIDLSRMVGAADYTAHLGANSGGANAVYWLEVQGRGAHGIRVRNLVGKAKRSAAQVEAEIEPDLLYPLIRWIDVDRWSARPSGCLLLAQDPQTRTGLDEARFRRDYPRTFAYLEQFQPLLTARAAYRRYQGRQPFYSMYNVGSYTVAPAKVVWRRMDRKIRAAVVEVVDDPHLGLRPAIPQETCVLIACQSGEEAHYLCALLNSRTTHELVASHSVAGGKGFGTPSILDYLPLRRFDPSHPHHIGLADLSRQLHAAMAEDGSEHALREIDRLAIRVFSATRPPKLP